MSDLLLLAAIVFGLRIFRLAQEALNLRGIELPLNPKRIVPIEDMPSHQAQLFEAPRAELIEQGFIQTHCESSVRFESGFERRGFEIVFVHPQTGCRAYLSIPDVPDGIREYSLGLVSELADGRILRTANLVTLFFVAPTARYLAQRAYAVTPAEQCRIHAAAAGAPANWPTTDPEQLCAAENQAFNGWFREQCSQKIFEERGGRVRFTLQAAFRASSKLVAETARYAESSKKASKRPAAAPLEVEVAAFEQLTAYNNHRRMQGAAKLVLLGFTAMLFMASFGMRLSFGSVLVLLTVLFIHELGHIAAMKMFGYRDLKMLFLPFLGAVAIGSKRNVSTFARVIVALAGPVPGIVLGIGGYALLDYFQIPNVGYLHEFLLTTLVLNFFNLLPIMPLDGGRVLHELIFSRVPWIEAAFSILGALLLGGSALLAHEPVLAFVALLILISTKSGVRRSKLLKSFRRKINEQRAADERQLTKEAFGHLSQHGCAKMPFGARYQLADYLLANVHSPAAGFFQTSFLLAVYLLFLVMAPAYFASTITVSRGGAHGDDGISSPVDDDGENSPFMDEDEMDDMALPERSVRA